MTNKYKINASSNRQSYIKAKSTASIDYTVLPKKIIKAVYSYQAQEEHELSFEKGDFFHVIGRENDFNWYVAFNPLSNAKGLVPVPYFEVIVKNTRKLSYIQPNEHPKQPNIDSLRSSMEQQPQQYYGIVLYDFIAERPDELECKANEAIVVIAQSNKEWYVAKPIARLGRAGLIPVSFVQLHDVLTNNVVFPNSSMPTSTSSQSRLSVKIPKLEEWKKMTQIYEASSISLHNTALSNNRYSSSSISSHYSEYPSHLPMKEQHPMSPSLSILSSSSTKQDKNEHSYSTLDKQQKQPHHEELSQFHSNDESKKKKKDSILKSHQRQTVRHSQLSVIKVVSVTVDSHVMEAGQYSFILFANVNNGKYRVLYRTYEDFYKFHIQLMQDYPEEGGKRDQPRIIPYMPGPLDIIDEEITKERRKDLDRYCKQLLTLPLYISESKLIQNQLLGMKQNDLEIEYDPQKGVISSFNNNKTTIPKTLDNYTQLPVLISEGRTKVKIKIVHKDDIFAVKMPADCSLQELKSHIKDRLGTLASMKYKNDIREGEYLPLETDTDMENAFALAIQRGKLTIFVD